MIKRIYLEDLKFPLAVKADELMAGKGVFICQDISDAYDAIILINRMRKKAAMYGVL